MPTDLVKRINLDLLYPEFRDQLLVLLAALRAKGRDYFALEGHRPMSRSDALYKAFLAGGPRAAPGGASGHNFGISADLCRDIDLTRPGLQPSWIASDYDDLAAECARLKMHHGRGYKDDPHVGLAGYVTGKDLAPLHQVYIAHRHLPDELDRLRPVWQYLDSKGATP